ncbi:MAG TPA: hypothetical protein VJ792_09440 [Candidatus Nitrosotalea sp.]|nr:hypothetical protein [Candidatus Nitrosotalea sp.]
MVTQSSVSSRESTLFAQKVARSIVEVQPNINNTADIVVLLECLGYRVETLIQYGFENFYTLAKHLYDFIDVYETRDKSEDLFVKSFTMDLPKVSKRISEGVGMVFPWLGSLALLFITGVSLWMAMGFPASVTTAFVAGVFLGVIVTEGTLQVFNRLFMFYHEPGNIGEVKRLIKRSYLLIGAVLAVALGVVFVVGVFEKIPLHLIELTMVSAVTVSLHRASYMIIYTLKKAAILIMSYSIAFSILLSTYYFGQPLVHSEVTRYFTGLLLAFAALSAFSVYEHYKLTKKITETLSGDKPHFYNPMSRTDKTLKSRFSVQLWEAIPFSLYSVFYVVTMFGDRVLSWIYNPAVFQSGYGLPMAFNPIYHTGADMAWLVLLPGSLIQYVMMAPIYIHMNNISLKIKISESKALDDFILSTYRRVLSVSMLATCLTAIILNVVAPPMMDHAGVPQLSIEVLRVASISNVFMSLFTVNSVFMMWMNKIKILTMLIMTAAFVVVTVGVLTVHGGLVNLAFGYLAGTAFIGIISAVYTRKTIRQASSIVFSKMV